MSVCVSITLFGWIPAVIGLFAWLSPRRAVIVAFVAAWLFLPMAGYPIPGLPDYTKVTATTYGVALGAFLFDWGTLARFRPGLIDLPMALWCACPMFSSLSNGLGGYDGLSGIINQTITWGLPYFIGRVYFSDFDSLRELGGGIFIGGLIYVPLCLLEIRLSPQLHDWLYGFHQHSFVQAKRFGGWRPTVFMQHGLMVGMWMSMSALVGVWMWWSGALRRVSRGGLGLAVAAIVVTSILCKSAGATALLFSGLAVLFMAHQLKRTAPILALIILVPTWMACRASGEWSGNLLLSLASSIDQERADSLSTRLVSENILNSHAMQRPVFGWGSWGRNLVQERNAEGRAAVPDALWVITFGKHGVVGLTCLTLALLWPAYLFARRYPASTWRDPRVAPAAALAALTVCVMIDNLFNAMLQPIFIVTAGGLLALTNASGRTRLASVANLWRSQQKAAGDVRTRRLSPVRATSNT